MHCGKCGTENDNSARFCKKCGSPLQNNNEIKNVLNSGVGDGNKVSEAVGKIPKKGIIVGVVAIALLVIVVAFGKRGTIINLNDYIVFNQTGCDGYGNVSVSLDLDAIEEKYGEKIAFSKRAKEEYGELLELTTPIEEFGEFISISLDSSDALSNGDTVNYTWNVDENLSEYLTCKVKYTDGSYTVSDLSEVGTYDVFEDVEIEFSGVAPKGELNFTYNGSELRASDFSIDKTYGLSNGDVVTVTISDKNFDKYAEEYGKVPEAVSKEYTVEGLDSYITKLSEVPEETLESLKAQAEDVFNAGVASEWGENEKLLSFEYLGEYLLNPDYELYLDDNKLFLVYKVQVEDTYSEDDISFDEIKEVYWYISFEKVAISADGDGVVDVTDYDTPWDKVEVHIDNVSYYWYYYGYETLDELYDAVFTESSEYYTVEGNIDTSLAETAVNDTEETDTEIVDAETTVDMKDYLTTVTSEYGGDLEETLAEKLGTTIQNNEYGDGYTICDGAIEIFGSANNTGYFVTQYQPVDGFSIYGVSVGMDKSEAEEILADQDLIYDENTEVYASDADVFYITFTEEAGTLTQVRYTRCLTRPF
ncbi:MAG: zinc ribbon domain-containing protein [Lachnospiraceae bacterium]|nr:zinc ribbon domain-containing protein [Lachnospiraceae bacterium]